MVGQSDSSSLAIRTKKYRQISLVVNGQPPKMTEVCRKMAPPRCSHPSPWSPCIRYLTQQKAPCRWGPRVGNQGRGEEPDYPDWPNLIVWVLMSERPSQLQSTRGEPWGQRNGQRPSMLLALKTKERGHKPRRVGDLEKRTKARKGILP